MMTKTTAALMTVVDICRNIGILHCFSAHVHTILCYDVISVKAQLCMLHVLLCDVISRGISISYNTAARGLTDIYARCLRARGVHIYQGNPEPGCVITFIFLFTRLTWQKVEGASSNSDHCKDLLHYN